MAPGYNAFADIIRTTVDGVDLNHIWDEHAETLQIWNDARSSIASLLPYRTDLSADLVPQTSSGGDFEEASEYGVPNSIRTAPDLTRVGFPLRWYDLATRYTWKFLSEASAAQVAAVHASALESDNKLVFGLVMRALLNSTSPGANDDGTPIMPLYNGDGATPPPSAGRRSSTSTRTTSRPARPRSIQWTSSW